MGGGGGQRDRETRKNQLVAIPLTFKRPCELDVSTTILLVDRHVAHARTYEAMHVFYVLCDRLSTSTVVQCIPAHRLNWRMHRKFSSGQLPSWSACPQHDRRYHMPGRHVRV